MAAAVDCPVRRSTPSPCASFATSPSALPGFPVIGVGGVASPWDAEEFLLAGAVAVQVGTATFHEPAGTDRDPAWDRRRDERRLVDDRLAGNQHARTARRTDHALRLARLPGASFAASVVTAVVAGERPVPRSAPPRRPTTTESDTVPVEVDLVGEAINGLSTFVAERLDTDDAHVEDDHAAVTLDECPILSFDDLAGLVGEPADPDDFRHFVAVSTSTDSERGDFLTLECRSNIVRSEGNELIDTAVVRILLYPEAPAFDEVLAASRPDVHVQRYDALGTVGYCQDLPSPGHECGQAWQSDRLIVTLSRAAKRRQRTSTQRRRARI